MNATLSTRLVAALALGLALTACNKPEDPAQTEADLAKTIAEGQAKVNEAAAEAVKEHVDAVVDAEGKPLPESAMKQDVNNLAKVEIELADANYKVALEKCDALAGDAKDGCQKQAKLDHEAALAAADARKAAAKAEVEALQPTPQ